MPSEDQPPERIWMDDEAISEHFDRVKERYRSGGSAETEAVPQADLEQNELTRHIKRR